MRSFAVLHLSDANSPLGSEGIPYRPESFESRAGAIPQHHRNELPTEDERVTFP